MHSFAADSRSGSGSASAGSAGTAMTEIIFPKLSPPREPPFGLLRTIKEPRRERILEPLARLREGHVAAELLDVGDKVPAQGWKVIEAVALDLAARKLLHAPIYPRRG